MKLRITCFTLSFAAMLTGMVATQDQRTIRLKTDETETLRWAILVGVNDYVHIGNLQYCVNDVIALRDELLKHGYDEKRMFCLTTRSEEGANFQPTYANITRIMSQVFRQVQDGDHILIVLSGHGLTIDGKSGFCPEDVDLKQLEKTLISIERIYELLDQTKATNKLLVVDACRNQPKNNKVNVNVPKEMSRNPLEGVRVADTIQGIEKLPPAPQGIVLLSSCDEGEFSFEDKNLGHGVFTHFLLEGIRGKADTNGDGRISLMELTNYVCEETPLHTMRRFSAAQTPYFTGKSTAFYIATTETKSTPGNTGDVRPQQSAIPTGTRTTLKLPKPAVVPPIPAGRRVNVSTVDELFTAVYDAYDGDVIVLRPGTYNLPKTLTIEQSVVLYGDPKNPQNVKIRGAHSNALTTGKRTSIQLIGLDITCSRGSYGVVVGEDSKTEIIFSHIHDCTQRGITNNNNKNAKIFVEHSVISRCGYAIKFNSGEIVANNCLITTGTGFIIGGAGIQALVAEVTGCEISGNKGDGIEVLKEGKIKVTDCSIRDNSGYGVLVRAGSNAEFHNNVLRVNKQGNWGINDSATVTRVGNRPNE